MTKKKYVFEECEHDGDLANYALDIINSGGTIIDRRRLSEETGCVIFEVSDYDAFKLKFIEKDSYGFVISKQTYYS